MVVTVTLNPAIDYHISIDKLELGKSISANNADYFAGGKGINVSRVLKNHNISTQALAFLGDFTGKYIQSLATDIILNIPIKGTTRINTKLKTIDSETEIHGIAPTICPAEFNSLQETLASLTMDYLVLSGSLPKGLSADSYSKIIKNIPKNVNIILDTRGNSLKESIQNPNIFLLKPNKDELSEFYNIDITSNEEALYYAQRLYQDYDIKYLIISLGKEGAYFLNENKLYFAKGLQGTLISSVGSGDSMIAGFIAKYIHTNDSIEAFKYAMACGAGTAFSKELCTEKTATLLFNQVEIIYLN